MTGGVAPGTITADTLVGTTNKIQFYSVSNYIVAPSDGKLLIAATAGGEDDIELRASGGVLVTGDLEVTGNTTLEGTLEVAGAATVDAGITITGAATISTTLAVTGAATFSSTVATGALTVTGAATISTTLAVTGAVTLSSTLSVGAITTSGTLAVTGKITGSLGIQARAQAVTATSDGLTTGVIADDSSIVTVTSSVNTKFVTLPTPTVGVLVTINAEATGYKLRSSTPASVAINGGTGATASTAVSAKTLVCRCVSATAWIVTAYAADGTVTAQAAAA